MNFENKNCENKELFLYKRDRQQKTIYAVVSIEPEPIKNQTGLNFYTYSDCNEQSATDYLGFIKDRVERLTKYNLPKQAQTELKTLCDVLRYINIECGCEY